MTRREHAALLSWACARWLRSPAGRDAERRARLATVRLCLAVEDGCGVEVARVAWREARAELVAWYRSRPRRGWKRRPGRVVARLAACVGDGVFRRAHGPRPRRPAIARGWSGMELRRVGDGWCLARRTA